MAIAVKVSIDWKANLFHDTVILCEKFRPFHESSVFLFWLTEINCPGDGSCSSQGTCDGTKGTCTCNVGFNGDNCESKLYWHTLNKIYVIFDPNPLNVQVEFN